MYQQITLIGNLGNQPEMRFTPSGVPVCSFSLAVNKKWTGQDGQQKTTTKWFRVTTWRKQAEIVNQYLTKGSTVMVVGEVEEAKPYKDRNGAERASIEITASVVKFLSSRGDAPSGAHDDGEPAHAGAPAQPIEDSEIPF